MCGIVGLFLKDKALEPKLGSMLSEMLVLLTDRGPDSAGIAIYGGGQKDRAKITVQSPSPSRDFPELATDLGNKIGAKISATIKSTHAVLDVPLAKAEEARAALLELRPSLRVMGAGQSIEIYKEVGLPEAVVERFDVRSMTGTH
ncbi:MAG: glutamine amidotransferase, partial [Mesorhizobium sp.]